MCRRLLHYYFSPLQLLLLLLLLLVNLLCYYFSAAGASVSASAEDVDDKCNVCQFLTRTFLEGLDKTQKLHFGGGNTDWEERKLGKFKTSETRFVEIMEHVCRHAHGDKDRQFKCHTLAEKHEELLEQWFFAHQDDGPSLDKFLCIDALKFCCENGYFGEMCAPCPGLKQTGRPCFGRGRCQGSGNRSGDGTCTCDRGYVGKMCSNCDSRYFATAQNATHIECEECFDGCSGGCTTTGPKGCRACRSGYTMDGEIGCKDIDECIDNGDDEKCGKPNEMCVNTPGSFLCRCADGFTRSDAGECELDVEARPNVPLLRADQQLRLIAYASLLLVSLLVFTIHRSTITVWLTITTVVIVSAIDFYYGEGILHFFNRLGMIEPESSFVYKDSGDSSEKKPPEDENDDKSVKEEQTVQEQPKASDNNKNNTGEEEIEKGPTAATAIDDEL